MPVWPASKKIEILRSWEYGARALEVAEEGRNARQPTRDVRPNHKCITHNRCKA
jgi:hypothetical protein